ncbi:tripartite motif-containing protein 45-like [Gigantopelta aegis]|uniref:tripartite motif-containing protein 45-like n=1 Tax=Gigantopelta aegis TaxID=1735272 RepID=UPI001B88AE74|nr:tripartite motif-containing protein 45-like [Gigantopelta aegis]
MAFTKTARHSTSDKLRCTACGETLRTPRLLPCLHSFCSDCISRFKTYPMNSEAQLKDMSEGRAVSADMSEDMSSFDSADDLKAGDRFGGKSRMILCPDCLREVQIATDVKELPINFVLQRKLKEEAFQRKNHCIVTVCDSCGETNDYATVRCDECSENLCYMCEQSHRRQKRSKNHRLVQMSASVVAMDEKRDSLRILRCSKHSKDELDLFCSDCDDTICRRCSETLHSGHHCSPITSDLFRQKMDELQRLIQDVVPKVSSVDVRLKNVGSVKDKIRTRAKQLESEVNRFMDSYVQAIEKQRQVLVDQIQDIVQDKERCLNVSELHLKDIKGEVGETCRLVSDLVDSGSDLEILTVKKLITGRLNHLNSLTLQTNGDVSEYMKFCPEEKSNVINNFQMFGKIVSKQASAAYSVITGAGLLTARLAHKSQMLLTVRDADDIPYTACDVSVRAWLIYQNDSLRSIPVSIADHKDGTYLLSFTPVQKGTHYLHVAVNGQPIKDSPSKFSVQAKWNDHRGVWQCCTFCQTGGRKDVHCGCKSLMPGGFLGCGHGHSTYPGGPHWSCCGKMVQNSECSTVGRASPVRQVTL